MPSEPFASGGVLFPRLSLARKVPSISAPQPAAALRAFGAYAYRVGLGRLELPISRLSGA